MTATTFHEIETAKGISFIANREQAPLSDWYLRLRDVPLSAFSIEDLCKSVRQCLYPEYIVPVALDALEKQPLAGDMYDGELVMSFRSVHEAFWRENQELVGRLLGVLKDVHSGLSNDLKTDVSTMIARIEALIGEAPVSGN